MRIAAVLIPPSAGVFSSFGLLYAEVEYYFTRTRKLLLRGAGAGRNCRRSSTRSKPRRGRGWARTGSPRSGSRSGAPPACITRGSRSSCACRSRPAGSTRAALAALEEAFGAEHERTYGHRAGIEEPVELVSLEMSAAASRIRRAPPRPPPRASRPTSRSPNRAGRAYFGPRTRLARRRSRQPQRPGDAAPRPVHRRGIRRDLPGPARLDGPARRVRQYRDHARRDRIAFHFNPSRRPHAIRGPSPGRDQGARRNDGSFQSGSTWLAVLNRSGPKSKSRVCTNATSPSISRLHRAWIAGGRHVSRIVGVVADWLGRRRGIGPRWGWRRISRRRRVRIRRWRRSRRSP